MRRSAPDRHQVDRRYALLAALLLVACGGQTAVTPEPPPPPRGPCPASHDLVGDRCVVREIYVPGGTFTMGRGWCPDANALSAPPGWECPLADPPHAVTVKPFYVDATVQAMTIEGPGNVVLGHFCLPDADCEPSPGASDEATPTGPASFEHECEKDGKHLLTEAQWEYLATGGGTRTYPWGEAAPSCARANIDPERCPPRWPAEGNAEVAQVASYPPTPEGVYDLAGNLPEAVAPSPEAYTDSYTAVPAEVPPLADGGLGCESPEWCPGAVVLPVRGGSATGPRDHLRSAYRSVATTGGHPHGQEAQPPGDGDVFTYRCARDAE